MELLQANQIIRLLHKRKISMFDGQKWTNTSVKKIIPMFDYKKACREEYIITDVEILTCKSKNTYFSISCYIENRSWIKNIKIKDEWDDSIKQRIISPDIQSYMKNDNYIDVAKLIQSLEKNLTK